LAYRILRALGERGCWVRASKVTGFDRGVVVRMVREGLVRRSEEGRYRITGAGFDMLELAEGKEPYAR
jgi:DNA-binding IclR family transcriptional regulator